MEFFETRVRPVLAEHCFSCHGAKIGQSGLRLDTRAGLIRGGARGPALVAGHPERSRLIQAVRHEGALKMPPAGQLSANQIAALEDWVRSGAQWPVIRTGDVARASRPVAHWAFRPVRRPAVPAVRTPSWVRTPVDAFILARLETKGLNPSPPADRRTLIRRAYFDLTGLPPAAEEIEAFAADRAPGAWERVVDRLLSSPHYGERWARYWLDVARYADTKGYIYTGERRYPFSYAYRDWVIRALNEDLPYDRFLTQQLAADLLPGNERRHLAALGFLTLGRRFVNMAPDIIDDRIDVVMRGTQGLTVACARCHDHKFDPIPTADYYALYGVFAGSTEKTVPLVERPEPTPKYASYEQELEMRKRALEEMMDRRCGELSERLRGRIADYLGAVPGAERLPGEEFYVIMGPDDVNPIIIRQWRAYVDRYRAGLDSIWGPWHAFEALPEGEFAARAAALSARFAEDRDPRSRLNPAITAAFAGAPPRTMAEVAARYGKALRAVFDEWQAVVKEAAAKKGPLPQALPDAGREALRQVLYASDSPCTIPRVRISETEYFFDEATRNELNELQAKVDRWQIESDATPPHALAFEELPLQPNPRVFIRGNPSRKGDEVPRRFLAVLSGPRRQPFRQGSGRLELARAIASPANPLTARVMVNRVWLHHFGAGLVRTPSDFGVRSDAPTHPGLLDYLGAEFIKDGWSLKRLHRLIMTSAVYMQSSGSTLESQRAKRSDPENRLLWRMNRRRLDWEALRDSLLAVSGRLDRDVRPGSGGPTVDLLSQPFTGRRSVYGFIDRQNLPGVFRTFDFANPDTHSPQRYVTTVPQQALFLLNSPFILEQARALAASSGMSGDADPESRIRALYRRVYGRDPTPGQVAVGRRFVDSARAADGSVPATPPVWTYGYGEVDEASARVKQFRPLIHFTGDAWQGGPKRPDAVAGWAYVTAEGGHAGDDQSRAVMRRWTAPVDGEVAISGTLTHGTKEGDGVRGRIISSSTGVLGTWTVHNGKADTAVATAVVRQGETLDFVVDCRASIGHDEFAWTPVVRLKAAATVDAASREWNAASDFGGPRSQRPPPLSPWERYAQALLLANEFIFVD